MTTAQPIPNHDAEGIVFDVQRGSLHDGPGVRTTVFLKGCPLRCAWCHNPESRQLRPQLGFDVAKCIGCQACASACESDVHHFVAGASGPASHVLRWGQCIAAGRCVTACPTGALQLYGSRRTVGSIMAEVEKDRVYYATLGGGLTLSGGEPTVQMDFCVALLTAARAAGISTCVETCGIGSPQAYEKLLPLTDVFLFDYKLTGAALHRELTGVPPDRILENLRWLHEKQASIVLRCPILPGINDADEHFAAIASLVRELGSIREVHLLPYHDSGRGKYDRIGEPRPSLQTVVPDLSDRNRWRSALLDAGCPDDRLVAN